MLSLVKSTKSSAIASVLYDRRCIERLSAYDRPVITQLRRKVMMSSCTWSSLFCIHSSDSVLLGSLHS